MKFLAVFKDAYGPFNSCFRFNSREEAKTFFEERKSQFRLIGIYETKENIEW